MRKCFASLGLLLCLGCSSLGLQAASAEILKVLPHYLDAEGRAALSPSLYERDAYQAKLRKDADLRKGLRFDVNWKAKHMKGEKLLLRIELRSSGREGSNPLVLERPVTAGRWFSKWSSLPMDTENYESFGDLIAWRATLWRGSELLAEHRSFLW